MAKDEQTHRIKRFSGLIFFILISALLWLIIKLSDTYTVDVPFAIHYVDVPAYQLIQDDDQTISATVTTTGFKLLNYYFTFVSNRKIDISLKEVNYQKDKGSVYYYNSRYIIDKVADFLSTTPSEVQLNDETQRFKMNPLSQKKVKVVPTTDISFEKQYNYYVEPSVTPDSITIYGAWNDIKDINEVTTEPIIRKNARNSFKTSAKIGLDKHLTADVYEVEITFNIERFTEANNEIPITLPDGIRMNLYPNKVLVRYRVAMKDYANINSMSFKATIDTTGMIGNNGKFKYEKMPVVMTLYPNNTQIIGIEPKEVEYIIVRQ